MAIILLKLLARLPLATIEPLVYFLYCLSWPLTARDRSLARRNAKLVLKLDDKESASFAGRVLRSQAIIYLETLKYIFFPERIMIIGKDEFWQIMAESEASNRGHVVYTAHLGAWELAGHFCAAACQRPVYVLAKPSKTAWINPVLDQMRQILKMKVLWTDSKSLFKDMLKILNDGGGLGFVMDQRPAKRDGGHRVKFLGVEDTAIVVGPATVITKKNVPAMGAYCVRVGRGQYRIFASAALKAGHGVSDLETISRLLAGDMEQFILRFPEQWAWNYKRWKKDTVNA